MSTETYTRRAVELADAIEDTAESGRLDYWTMVYTTPGGSRMIASTPESNDDDRPHDLILVHPAPIDGAHMIVLRPNVDPTLSAALHAELARRRS